ncbi:MAG: hypothetical protein LBQ34_02795 [Alphaproteobacteria bacterium]|nr:hypothetical protein [Alphaproteobacteria bacterium]
MNKSIIFAIVIFMGLAFNLKAESFAFSLQDSNSLSNNNYTNFSNAAPIKLVRLSMIDTTILGEIGRSHLETIGGGAALKTNPYEDKKNSLTFSAGGVSHRIIEAHRYSLDSAYSSYGTTGLNKFQITSNYSFAYLRKITDKLSIGIEAGVFNPGKSYVEDDLISLRFSKTRVFDPRINLNYSDNVCNYGSATVSQAVVDFCDAGGGQYSTCSLLSHLIPGATCDGGGYVNDTTVCNNIPSQYASLCSGGALDEAQFCNIVLGGTFSSNRCVFSNGNTINPPGAPDPCELDPSLPECQIPPPPPDTCLTDITLCTTPDIGMPTCDMTPQPAGCPDSGGGNGGGGGGGGGDNKGSNIKKVSSITSNAYTAMFLVNYEVYRTGHIGLAIEGGFGANYRELRLKGDMNGSGASTALSGKTGIVGSYYFTNNFALGVGTHYVYLGEQKFTKLGKSNDFAGYDFKFKSLSTITYNLQLKYMF